MKTSAAFGPQSLDELLLIQTTLRCVVYLHMQLTLSPCMSLKTAQPLDTFYKAVNE